MGLGVEYSLVRVEIRMGLMIQHWFAVKINLL